MKTLQLLQGSPEWLAHRRSCRNASDAPALMGASKYVSRSELVKRRATGIEPEDDNATLARFARGHEVEPALRAHAELLIGEDLYPVVVTDDEGYMGASLDGLTMGEETIFEAKQPNAEKIAAIKRGEIPADDYWQIVQQFFICESAKRCIYCVGDGSDAGTHRLEIARSSVEHDFPKLLAAWKQLDADVAAYQPEAVQAPVVAAVVENLPAVSVRMDGQIAVVSNLDLFGARLKAYIEGLNLNPQTDQDFADCEDACKRLAEAESALKAAETAALSEIAPVELMRRTVADYLALSSVNRLKMEKLVKAAKDARKAAIVSKGVTDVLQHYAMLSEGLGLSLQAPLTVQNDANAAIKGLRTLTSVQDAVSQVVANHKIEASQAAERVRANIAALAEINRPELFPDRDQLVRAKPLEDLRNLAQARVADAMARENARLEAERERIRLQEQARAQAEVAPPATPIPQAVPPATSAAAPAAVAAIPEAAPRAAASAGARIKLGDINARLAPITLTADGLASLGFQSVGSERAAKLYDEAQFADICRALGRVLRGALETYGMKEAA